MFDQLPFYLQVANKESQNCTSVEFSSSVVISGLNLLGLFGCESLYLAMNPWVSFKVFLNQIKGSFTAIVHYDKNYMLLKETN